MPHDFDKVYWGEPPGADICGLPDAPATLDPAAVLVFSPRTSAALSYVSPDGCVRLPRFVTEGLGLRHGGGVVFLPMGRGFHILTNADAVALLNSPAQSDPALDED